MDGPVIPRPGTIGDRIRRAEQQLDDLEPESRRASPATFSSALRASWRLLRAEMINLPDRIDRWLLTMHRPVDVLGDGSVAVCRLCKVRWPCSEFVEINDRITAREEDR